MENEKNPPDSPAPPKSRPPLSLWFFCLGLFVLIIVVKFASCTIRSQVDLQGEMKKAQNPPQVEIVP